MQVLAGDVLAAQESYWHYFTLWKAFGALPERFLYGHGQLHSNQQQYALRPELMESTFYLYQVAHCGALVFCVMATCACVHNGNMACAPFSHCLGEQLLLGIVYKETVVFA